jgi:hypothetical protein
LTILSGRRALTAGALVKSPQLAGAAIEAVSDNEREVR